MSEEQLRAFLEAVKSDATLQEKLKGVSDPDQLVALAKQMGFEVSALELSKLNEDKELSDEELETVAGGGTMTMYSRCKCDPAPANQNYTSDRSIPDCMQ
jgi:predicted ribosomally synthesized peptide with nif11-like leader